MFKIDTSLGIHILHNDTNVNDGSSSPLIEHLSSVVNSPVDSIRGGINSCSLTLSNINSNVMEFESVRVFNYGDVVYGIANVRNILHRMIEDLNGLTKKDIVIQNTLSDAVWDRKRYCTFKTDAQIGYKINDANRGVEFKKFLKAHDRYNVTKREFSTLSRDQSWAKISKAGLEFQTSIREKKVIFCVDLLIDSIPDIATKSGKLGDAITAHELRWIYRHRGDKKVKDNVVFSLGGNIISQNTVFSLKGWELYQPKRAIPQIV